MGWVHDVPEDDLYDHEGYAQPVLADGTEPEPVQGNSSWWTYDGKDGRPLAAKVKAGCSCGWRSTETFPIDFDDWEATDGYEYNDGPFGAWSYEHIASLLGTAMPRELTEALDTVGRLVRQLAAERPLVALTAVGRIEKLVGDVAPTAGAAARKDGQTWAAVGRALNTSRQAAYQRFSRFLDPELVSNPQD
jgi:hypothetical protein